MFVRTRTLGPAAGLTLVGTLILAACSGTASPSPSPTPTSPPPAAVLLLRVTSEGGFINPAANLAALPIVTVYADGRILTAAASVGDAPSPLVSPVSVRDVGAAGADAILAAIRAAGLDHEQSGGPGIPGDSGTDVFTAVVEGVSTTTRLAGSSGPGIPGGGGGDDPQRAAAFDLLARLLDPTDGWGGSAPTDQIYAPIAYRVYEAPAAGAGDGQQSVAWPLATALADFGAPAAADLGIAGLRSGVVTGADLAILQPVLDAAAPDTVFTSAGQPYTLMVRPLLPDELGS